MPQTFPKKLHSLLTLLSLLGLADASYLTWEHFLGQLPPCTISGCELVLTSSYSQVWGVPLAFLGALFYLVMLLILCFIKYQGASKLRLILLPWSGVGLLTSLTLTYIQFYVIGAICPYCLFSAGINFVLFIIAWSFFNETARVQAV